MPFDLATIGGAFAALVSGLATGAGAVVGLRRARGESDRLALQARDEHLDRLEGEIERLDQSLSRERVRGEECERLHRECTADTDRLRRRVAGLEERLDAVEARSGDSTPAPSIDRGGAPAMRKQ